MLYITTSNGLLKYDISQRTVLNIFSPQKSLELFGITYDREKSTLVIASRDKPAWYNPRRKSSSVTLYSISLENYQVYKMSTVKRAYDVHQIASNESSIFITDTTKNRVHVFDMESHKVKRIINIGHIREDINHINAVCVSNNNLLIGLNNRGITDAAILTISLDDVYDYSGHTMQAEDFGTIKVLSGRVHTHDITPYNNTFLVSASHDGCIFQIDTDENLCSENEWVRGTTVTEDGIWIGISQKAERAKRHSAKLDGAILFFDHREKRITQRIPLVCSGQVNDILYVK